MKTPIKIIFLNFVEGNNFVRNGFLSDASIKKYGVKFQLITPIGSIYEIKIITIYSDLFNSCNYIISSFHSCKGVGELTFILI